MNIYASTIRTLAEKYPAVIPLLKGRARWVAYTDTHKRVGHSFWGVAGNRLSIYGLGKIYELDFSDAKSYDFYLQNLERLIRSVYNGDLGGSFVDVMANLISGQLTQAFEQAWKDEEGEGELPDYLAGALEDMILGQYDHVDQLYRDIVDARVDETPIDPLLARAGLWAERWNEAYNRAVALITAENGGNLVWELGETEEHCETCAALNGIVARATEWEQLGIRPQGAPNDILVCGGWHCDCRLSPTDKRRSPRAFDALLNIANR